MKQKEEIEKPLQQVKMLLDLDTDEYDKDIKRDLKYLTVAEVVARFTHREKFI